MPSTSAENIKALMPSAVENQMAISALNLFLNTAATKMPVKRADIVKQCLQGNNGRFAQILDIVTEWLLDVRITNLSWYIIIPCILFLFQLQIYGFSMHEIRDDKTSKGFICISNISGSSNVELTNEQRRNLKLLYLVLSYIYMKGESVLEGIHQYFLPKKMHFNFVRMRFFSFLFLQLHYLHFYAKWALRIRIMQHFLIFRKLLLKYLWNNCIWKERKLFWNRAALTNGINISGDLELAWNLPKRIFSIVLHWYENIFANFLFL